MMWNGCSTLALTLAFSASMRSVIRPKALGGRADLAAPRLGALLNATIARIAEGDGLLAVQQIVRPRHITDVGGGCDQAVDEVGAAIDADVRLHLEVPHVALLGLVHLGIARTGRILDRGRSRDDGGIDDGALLEKETLPGQMILDRGEKPPCQAVRFE
jgi:hypothetical protein